MKRTTIVVGCLLAASSAFAAPKKRRPPPDKTEKTPEQKEADRHFKSGVQFFSDQKYAEALAEFERAYEIAPATIVLYNMAACHRYLSHYSEAVKYYRRFLDESEGASGKVPADRIVAAKAELDDILSKIARVSVTAPDGAEVVVDGVTIGTMPLDMPLIVAPGEHKVVVRLAGKKDGDKNLHVASGDEVSVKINLADAPKAPPPEERVVLVHQSEEATGPKVFSIMAGFGTNFQQVAKTGVPELGLGYAITDRLEVALDVTLIAYAVMPSVRVRLIGDRASLHLIGAVPIAFTDGGMSETWVSGAAGLGIRIRATPSLALHLESYASYATKDHGVTFPAFVGGEVWF
jgi:hypothetical protein